MLTNKDYKMSPKQQSHAPMTGLCIANSG